MTSKSKSSVLAQLIKFLLPYKSTLIAAAIALVFTAAMTLAMGQGVRLLIDEGFVAGSIDRLEQAALFIIGIAILMAAGTYARFYLVTWLANVSRPICDWLFLIIL